MTRVPMSGIVLSCDRAMQLDGTLRSFLLHCEDSQNIRLFVIYRARRSRDAQQYKRLAEEHATRGGIIFVEERRFRSDVLGVLMARPDGEPAGAFRRWLTMAAAKLGFPGGLGLPADSFPYVLFLVDDNIFIRDFRLLDIVKALEAHPDALGFSLRLGRNITYFYMQDRPQKQPRFTQLAQDMLKFDWTTGDDDFGYPLEVSSSVYRLDGVLPLLVRSEFRNPNSLEAQMAANVHAFRAVSPFLLCYEQSATFCNAINVVQTVWPNRSGMNPEYAGDRLAQKFDEGYRIDVKAYSGLVPNACHQEVELFLSRR